MNIKAQIDKDLKVAMLAGNKDLVMTLRGLKSAILYAEVASGSRDEGLPEAEALNVLAKESKKRQESIDMYKQGGNLEKAAAEEAEKQIIQNYLPVQLTEQELTELVDKTIKALKVDSMQSMGQVIGAVKKDSNGQADGAEIARIVKERLTK